MSIPAQRPSRYEQKIGMGWESPQEQEALSILNPTGQGEEPEPHRENLMAGLYKFIAEGPGHLLTIHKSIERMAKLIEVMAGPYIWANCADVSNGAVTAIGSQAYSNAFVGYTSSQAVVLRNCYIGASAANLIQLIAVRNGGQGSAQALLTAPMLSTPAPVLLTTVRLTATLLSQVVPGEFIVPQGCNVYLLIPAGGSPMVDFSCDYRYLPDL